MPLRLNGRLSGIVSLFIVVSVTALAYQPGLHGPFVFDDLHNIVDNAAVAIQRLDFRSLTQAAFARDIGLSARPLSMVSFALNHYAGGFDPFGYKLTNVVIHLVIGLCLWLLTRQMLAVYRSRWEPRLSDGHVRLLSATVAAAWLLHPLNVSSVLYVVQRMNQLAVLLTCAGLILYMWGRVRLGRGWAGPAAVAASVVVFTPLAILAKENGALLPLYAFIIELCLFRFDTGTPGRRRLLAGLFTVCLALPLAAFLGYIAVNPQWLMKGYVNRGFDLPQRLLTEARAIWYYLSMIAVPDVGRMGLYHDDFALSRSWLAPWSTLPAVLGIGGLLALAAACYRRAPLVALAILFYLGGMSMESTIIPLEPVFEHRNYLPMYGPLLAAFYYLTHPGLRQGTAARLRWGAAFVAVAALTFPTTLRAYEWRDALALGTAEVGHHPGSPRANYELGRVYYIALQNGRGDRRRDFLAARRYFARATLTDPAFVNGLFGMLQLYQLVHATMPPQLKDMLAQRLADAPFANNAGNMLGHLLDCQEQGSCRFSRQVLQRLVQAALSNRTLKGVNRASVLTTASRVSALAGHYEGALQYARQAVVEDPSELQYRLNTVHWLITLGRLQEARAALAQYQAMDATGRYAEYIAEQTRRLRDARLVRELNGGAAATP